MTQTLIFGVPVYAFFAGIGLAISYTNFFSLMIIKGNLEFRKNTIAIVIALCGALIGARILGIISSLIVQWNSVGNISFFDLEGSGLVFYGGLYGFLVTYVLSLKKQKEELTRSLPIIVVCIPLFHGFGRVGCFFVGCCFGTELVSYSNYEIAFFNVSRMPVQLIEAGANLLLFFLLLVFLLKNIFLKFILSIYLVSYSVIRFVLEFYRGDVIRGYIGFLSLSQVIAMATIFGAGVYIYLTWRRDSSENL